MTTSPTSATPRVRARCGMTARARLLERNLKLCAANGHSQPEAGRRFVYFLEKTTEP